MKKYRLDLIVTKKLFFYNIDFYPIPTSWWRLYLFEFASSKAKIRQKIKNNIFGLANKSMRFYVRINEIISLNLNQFSRNFWWMHTEMKRIKRLCIIKL